MAKQDIIDRIIEFFEANKDIFNDCVEELDRWNGFLGDDCYYCMDEIDEVYAETQPSILLSRAFYGHDEDSKHTNRHGQIEYEAFNPNRKYFYYNGYGNLVSTDYKDYSCYIDVDAVEQMCEHRSEIDSIEKCAQLIDLFDEFEVAKANGYKLVKYDY